MATTLLRPSPQRPPLAPGAAVSSLSRGVGAHPGGGEVHHGAAASGPGARPRGHERDPSTKLLALALAKGADAREVRELLLRALKTRETQYGPSHVMVGEACCVLGTACRRLGDTRGARQHMERGLELLERHAGRSDASVATVLCSLARLDAGEGKWELAKERLERALRIQERHFAPFSARAETAFNLRHVCASQGDKVRAGQMARECVRLWDMGQEAASVASATYAAPTCAPFPCVVARAYLSIEMIVGDR